MVGRWRRQSKRLRAHPHPKSVVADCPDDIDHHVLAFDFKVLGAPRREGRVIFTQWLRFETNRQPSRVGT